MPVGPYTPRKGDGGSGMLARFCTLAWALLAAVPALGQAPQVIEANAPENFNESYDLSAPVAGSPLVGLRLGDLEAAGDNAITVIGPPAGDSGVCLRVTTKDGRFSSANNFGVTGNASGQLVRISPLTQEYRSQLSQYPAGEIAFRAFGTSSSECVPARALNLPVLGSDAATSSRLVLFANGKSQPATVALYPTDATEPPPGLRPVAETGCTPATGGTTVAYDLVCRLDLPSGYSGRALLALEFSDGFSTDSYYYATLVPQLAAP